MISKNNESIAIIFRSLFLTLSIVLISILLNQTLLFPFVSHQKRNATKTPLKYFYLIIGMLRSHSILNILRFFSMFLIQSFNLSIFQFFNWLLYKMYINFFFFLIKLKVTETHFKIHILRYFSRIERIVFSKKTSLCDIMFSIQIQKKEITNTLTKVHTYLLWGV